LRKNSAFHPRLAPWAAVFRHFAAENTLIVPLFRKSSSYDTGGYGMIRIVSANPALERWVIGGTGKRFPKGYS
jgi:hypothetical protein